MKKKTKKEKRMLLIQPTIYDNNHLLVKKNRLYFIGLTMPLLAAECGDDWDVQICIETIEDIPWDTDIDLIGIGSMGHSIIRGIEIAKEFKKRGVTMVFVSHNMADVLEICDSVVWLDKGVIKEIGETKEIAARYIEDMEQRGVIDE